MKLSAEWTDDCQGKKDYDGDIISISTRYWPRDGGFGVLVENNKRQVKVKSNTIGLIKPSAVCELVLWTGKGNYITVSSIEFKAETEEEVKKAVEEWAQRQFDTIVKLLRAQYPLLRKV